MARQLVHTAGVVCLFASKPDNFSVADFMPLGRTPAADSEPSRCILWRTQCRRQRSHSFPAAGLFLGALQSHRYMYVTKSLFSRERATGGREVSCQLKQKQKRQIIKNIQRRKEESGQPTFSSSSSSKNCASSSSMDCQIPLSRPSCSAERAGWGLGTGIRFPPGYARRFFQPSNFAPCCCVTDTCHTAENT